VSKKDVAAREQEWLKAFNAGDASAVAGMYTAGARMMAPNADIVEGRPAVESFVKEFVQTGAQLSFDLLTVHESPSMCAAVGRYTMDIPGAPQDRGKFMEIGTRQDDGAWQIAEDIFNSSLPAAPA
jgi:ketosteroid isomerase-like protein